MAKIINKTDHVIALLINDTWETIMPQGLSCKLKATKSDPITKDGIQFNPIRYDSVVSLPERQLGTIIIVEREVALFIWKTNYLTYSINKYKQNESINVFIYSSYRN